MKKKIGAIVMASVMACTMTAGVAFASGCGSRLKADFVMPEGGFDSKKEINIKFYHSMGSTDGKRDVLQYHISKFNEMFPNIHIAEDAIGGYDDVRDQINTEIIAGDQPNIAYCYPDHVALFNQAGAVQSLNDFLSNGAYNDVKIAHADGTSEPLCLTKEEEAAFIKGYWDEGWQFDDGSKMYTLPFSKSTEVLYYNKTFFEKEGLPVPETWNDMEKVCKTIKERYPKSIPFGYDSEANWFITMCEQYQSDYTSPEGEKYLFNNATNRGFVEKFRDWYSGDNGEGETKGYFTTRELNGKRYTSNLFVAQTSYMSIGSSAGATNQRPKKVDKDYPFDVGITSIPQLYSTNPEHPDYKEGYQPKVISQGPSICIFKQDDPQEVLASWLFVKYLTTNVDFQAQFADASGYVPVITTVLENEIYKEYMEKADGGDNIAYLAAKVCMEQEKYYFTSPAFVGSSKARDMVGSLMYSVFSGNEKSIEEAFKYAVQQCKNFAK